MNRIKNFFAEHRAALPIILTVLALTLIVTEAVMLRSYFKDPDEIPVIGGEETEGSRTTASKSADSSETDDPDETADSDKTDASETANSDETNTFDAPDPTEADATDATSGTDSTTAPPASTAKITTGSATITATFAAGNTWPDGGKTVTQFDGKVSNTGGTACSSWTITVEVPKDAEIIGSWNGVYSVSGGKLTISNEVYNGEIAAGGSTDVGFQIKSASAVNIGSAAGTGTGGGSGNNTGTGTGTGTGTPPPAYKPSDLKGKKGDDWLSVKGNKIVDKDGREVWLTGVNWFGYNTGTNTFDGLWNSNLESSLQGIADHGFNLLRVPISAELILNWKSGTYPKANYNNASNAKLNDMNSLEIFEYVLEVCSSVGIKVMPDIHSAKTDASGHNYPVWYNGNITADDYYASLEWMADRYKDNDTIIAYDLKNEPHGKPHESPRAKWDGSKDADNWKHVAETAALKILAKNPNVLIMVEGIEIYPKDIKKNGDFSSKNESDYYYNWWGGNLRGVKNFPVNLGKFQNKLVYSPHDYGPTVFEQPWFSSGYNYDSLMKDCWKDNWFYIYENKTAPLLIGEWGGFMSEPNLTWMTHMRTLIKTYKLNHTFWCYNANSGDTGGLVKDDFVTWDEEKYKFVKEVLWQKDGKFVGLDHEIPLGINGVALK